MLRLPLQKSNKLGRSCEREWSLDKMEASESDYMYV
jgi:hypothetical protein